MFSETRIDNKHKEYELIHPDWELCRDTYAGSRVVKKQGIKYLPQPSKMDYRQYDAYVKRSLFFNAIGGTVDGIQGLIWRRAPTIELNSRIEYLNELATVDGDSLTMLMQNISKELAITGKYLVLIDFNESGEVLFCCYPAESILNWKYSILNNRKVLTKIVLYEDHYSNNDEIIREIILEDNTAIHNIYRKKADNDSFDLQDTLVPQFHGKTATEIPLHIFDMGKMPLLDLAEVNISHYQSSADLEHGRHLTALPTLILYLLDKLSKSEMNLGSGGGEVFQVGEKIEMLEFKGSGLNYLESALVRKEEQMASLGAKMLEIKPRAAETAETLRLRQAGEVSKLTNIVNATEYGMNKLLKIASDWMGIAGDSHVEINKDFFDGKMSSSELHELVLSWQSGALPTQALAHQLKKGEMLSPNMTEEQAIEIISDNQLM